MVPEDEAIPVCIGCFTPVDHDEHYCPKCGSAVGRNTEYMPFVNIPWQATGYDRLRRATWSSEAGPGKRVLRLFVTVFLAPFLLFGLPFKWLAERRLAKRD